MSTAAAKISVPVNFGLAIQQARLAQGLTQADLSEKLDLMQSAISQIESGKSTIFLRDLLEILAELGIELSATWSDERGPRR